MSAPSSNPDRPPAAVVREARPSVSSHETDIFGNQEAFELQEIQTHEDNQLDYSSPSASSGEEYRVSRRTTRRRVRPPGVHRKGLFGKFAWFWTHHVTLTVPQKSNRDHLGMWNEIESLVSPPMV